MLIFWVQHPPPQQRGHVAPSGMEAAFRRESDAMSSFLPRSMRKVLLSQSLLTTLNGPVYLGMRLGFPSLSSQMYTCFAVLSDFTMNGDDLKRRRSRVSGVKASALDLANSNCSAAVVFQGCSSWKQQPRMRNGMPKTTSAVDVTVSSFGALLSPSKTQGSDRDHDLLACTAHRRESFRVLWKRSTMPLACRW